ncbi:hypothetical protein CLIB1444_18S00848 [[Candida] jaroonii]|uniref:Uncharacterized protein n=1 Tax=[Candida] jaroonii TaxID=467808 RepID=A0ACA9YF15_9ASCO|nr:hypothetical protein CLIB1444_18S00848 [[Candida] jaroonii]
MAPIDESNIDQEVHEEVNSETVIEDVPYETRGEAVEDGDEEPLSIPADNNPVQSKSKEGTNFFVSILSKFEKVLKKEKPPPKITVDEISEVPNEPENQDKPDEALQKETDMGELEVKPIKPKKKIFKKFWN